MSTLAIHAAVRTRWSTAGIAGAWPIGHALPVGTSVFVSHDRHRVTLAMPTKLGSHSKDIISATGMPAAPSCAAGKSP
jgi:hypothetical protein